MRFLCAFALYSLLAISQTPDEVRRRMDGWDVEGAVAAARTQVERAGGGASLARAEALDLLGESLSLAGDPSALAVLEEALSIKTGLLPAGGVALAETHLRIAAERGLRRQWAVALTTYQRALANIDGSPGAAAEKLRPAVLLGIGVASTTLGQSKNARAALEAALAGAEKQFGADGRMARDVLRALSTLAYQESNLKLAEEYLERSQNGSAHDPVEASQQLALTAGMAMERARYDEAEAGLRSALDFHEARLGAGNRRVLHLVRNLSRCYGFQAKFQQAIQLGDRAVGLSVRAYGEESTTTAELMATLATAKAESGRLPEARQSYDRALAIYEKGMGPSHSLVGFTLFSLANLEQVMGDFDSALRHAGRALEIREATDGKESARTANIYSLLGRVNAMNGNPAKGRQLAELAVAIALRTVGEAHPRTVFAKSDLGETLYMGKDYEGARRQFTEALAGQSKLFGADSVRTAQTEYNLGLAERALGQHAEALKRFARAGGIWRKAFGPDYLFLAETNAGQAASLVALQRPVEALEPALEAARVRRTSLDTVTMTAAEREALLFARVDRDGLLLAIDLAATGQLDTAAVMRVWDAVIRDRAAVLDGMARRRQAAQTGGAAAEWMTQISRLKKELAQAALVGDPKVYLSRVTELRGRLDGAERELARQSVRFAREEQGARAGWREVMAAMPAGSALVGYARGEANYVAFVGAAGVVRAAGLGPVARVEGAVKAWQVEMERERSSAGRNARRNEAAYRVAGEALRRMIWDAVERTTGKARTVFAVPDGVLQLVNLDTLPVGPSQYLAETGPQFHIVPAERDLVSPPLPGAGKGGSLLALGNPAFGGLAGAGRERRAGSCEDLQSGRFPALPGSGAEVQSVGQLWTGRGGKSAVLRGGDASESELKAQAAGKQVLHLATHGFFLDAACQRGREVILAANPLLRSGLVLAAGGAGHEDGLLTAEEVSALRLDATELVVLSGCDTGRGAAEAGEGLLGLRRAFQAAGARQVVSSLWPIEDAATRTWMVRFYRARLERGVAVAQAVRAASVAALRERRAAGQSTHPFFWGSFVASGF